MLRTIYGDKERYQNNIGVNLKAIISPATARAAIKTATFGSSAALMTFSTLPATGLAHRKSKARWSVTRGVAEAAVVGQTG